MIVGRARVKRYVGDMKICLVAVHEFGLYVDMAVHWTYLPL